MCEIQSNLRTYYWYPGIRACGAGHYLDEVVTLSQDEFSYLHAFVQRMHMCTLL